jgi:hypothetical protein
MHFSNVLWMRDMLKKSLRLCINSKSAWTSDKLCSGSVPNCVNLTALSSPLNHATSAWKRVLDAKALDEEISRKWRSLGSCLLSLSEMAEPSHGNLTPPWGEKHIAARLCQIVNILKEVDLIRANVYYIDLHVMPKRKSGLSLYRAAIQKEITSQN